MFQVVFTRLPTLQTVYPRSAEQDDDVARSVRSLLLVFFVLLAGASSRPGTKEDTKEDEKEKENMVWVVHNQVGVARGKCEEEQGERNHHDH